jgi:hypothetical protein
MVQENCTNCGKTLREQMKGCTQITCYRQFLPKHETVEKASERCFKEMQALNPKGGLKEFIRMAVNFGAKWQAERMYSEEDMDNYAEYCINHFAKSQIGQPYLSAKEWFEQFKNK